MPAKKTTSYSLPKIIRDGERAIFLIAIGLHDLYRPVITEEASHLGSWVKLASTTDEPRLELRLNDDGEFAASSDRQFGPFAGEVSIPALLTFLHLHGQKVQQEGQDVFDGAYEEIVDAIFSRLSLEEFESVTNDFTEMSYNATLILGGPGNIVLKRCLAETEQALAASGADTQFFFSDNTIEMSELSLTDETVQRMEAVLGQCRDLVPRDPDNALSHYFSNLAQVIETRMPPAAVAEVIEAARKGM